MASQTMSTEQAWQIAEMYEQRDEFGRRVHTYQGLAEHFNVSETTILRVCKRRGPFRNLPPPLTQEQIDASAAKLIALMNEQSQPKARDMSGVTLQMRNRLVAYGQWTDQDEQAWQAVNAPKTP